MTYDRFVMSILERVQKGVGDSVSVSVYTAVKNNGTKRKGTSHQLSIWRNFIRGSLEV